MHSRSNSSYVYYQRNSKELSPSSQFSKVPIIYFWHSFLSKWNDFDILNLIITYICSIENKNCFGAQGCNIKSGINATKLNFFRMINKFLWDDFVGQNWSEYIRILKLWFCWKYYNSKTMVLLKALLFFVKENFLNEIDARPEKTTSFPKLSGLTF